MKRLKFVVIVALFALTFTTGAHATFGSGDPEPRNLLAAVLQFVCNLLGL